MHKIVNTKLLSFILLSSIYTSCDNDNNPTASKVQFDDHKCYHACLNMYKTIEKATKGLPIHNNIFARNFAALMEVRNESQQNKNSVDLCLNRLFLRGKDIPNEAPNGYIAALKEISDQINKQSDSKFFLLGNSCGKNDNFIKLGNVFKSNGLCYALISESNGGYNIFFSKSDSVNNIFFDEEGNEYDSKKFLDEINQSGNFECAVVPFLDLRLKDGATFCHLGSYLGKGRFGISMLVSLISAKIMEQKKNAATQNSDETTVENEKNIFLFTQKDDQFDKNVDAFEIFPSSDTFFQKFIENIGISSKIFSHDFDFFEAPDNSFFVFCNNVLNLQISPDKPYFLDNYLPGIKKQYNNNFVNNVAAHTRSQCYDNDCFYRLIKTNFDNWGDYIEKKKKYDGLKDSDPDKGNAKSEMDNSAQKIWFKFLKDQQIKVKYFIVNIGTSPNSESSFDFIDDKGKSLLQFEVKPISNDDFEFTE